MAPAQGSAGRNLDDLAETATEGDEYARIRCIDISMK